MKKIAVIGCKGKMGSLICEALKNDYDIVGIDKTDILENCNVDLVVDFASASSSVKSALFCERKNIPIIIGSTGQSNIENEKIELISKKICVLKCANFSRGIRILKQFIDNIMPLNPDRIEIVEKHHKEKKYIPSGTALELKKYILNLKDIQVDIISIREGMEMGEHKICAYFRDEKLEIKHNVYSRNAFVRGVVNEIKRILN